MKRYLFVILIFCSNSSFSQTKEISIEKIWDKCFDEKWEVDSERYLSNKAFCDSSLPQLIESKKKVDSLSIATFLLGQIHFYNKSFDQAMECFKTVQKMKFRKGIDQNYKYHSAIKITEIQTIQKNLPEAIKSLESTKKKYKFSHWCGNAFSFVDYNYDIHLAEIEFQKGNKKIAFELLEPYLFTSESGLYNEAPDKLVEWLKNDYSEGDIFFHLYKSMEEITRENIDSKQRLIIPVKPLSIEFNVPISLIGFKFEETANLNKIQVDNLLKRKIKLTPLFINLENQLPTKTKNY